MAQKNRMEWGLLGFAFLATIFAVAVYITWFRDEPIGGPAAWSQFGDYFSGVLNPIIGVVTVVLVVLTLRTTRAEAADTRRQMDEQTKHFQQQATLTEMHKRLDGVLAEWNRILDRQAPDSFQTSQQDRISGRVSITTFTIRDVVEDLATRSQLIREKHQSPNPDDFTAPGWQGLAHLLVPVLSELDRYCVDYQQAAGSRHLTDFYKARVREGLTTLKVAGVTPHIATARLLNEPLPQGPGGN